MSERKFDQQLHIRTVGLREWGQDENLYNRYEATPYRALEKFFSMYRFSEEDHLLDIGSGRGRVVFYIHNRFNISVTGVEANGDTFEEALINKKTYRRTRSHLKAPITFEFALAEQYEIDARFNRFFMFNPFSLKIFRKVIWNIIQSFEKNKRTIELILYYPLPEFKRFLQMKTPFEMINKVNVAGDHGKYGKFAVYRLAAKTE